MESVAEAVVAEFLASGIVCQEAKDALLENVNVIMRGLNDCSDWIAERVANQYDPDKVVNAFASMSTVCANAFGTQFTLTEVKTLLEIFTKVKHGIRLEWDAASRRNRFVRV